MGDQISTVAFSREHVLDAFGKSPSAEYLADYLTHLRATDVLVEAKYVDRHFLDDYVQFYSRAFEPPVPHCKRHHFFCTGEEGSLEKVLEAVHGPQEERDQAHAILRSRYLGFVVQRPLRNTPMGRTVLCTYSGDNERLYTVVRTYRAHVLGLELQVDGLAYQQQDGGAAVCASTALWSAFQQVARLSGERTPTPAAVTRAARSPFPASHGLGDGDMARAIDALGYAADRFKPGDNTPLFRAQVASFLRSRHPVLLLLSSATAGVGHAVTVTGYRESEPASVDIGPAKLLVRGADATTLYVHDDNLGSHAHYEFFDYFAPGGPKGLYLLRGRSKGPGANPNWWPPDVWQVDGALVPKPEKVRLPIEQLYALLVRVGTLFKKSISSTVGQPAPALALDAYYASGVSVHGTVCGEQYLRTDAATWHRTHTLPRHVAIIEITQPGTAWAVEFVFDATTLLQHQQGPLAILCPRVSRQSTVGRVVEALAVQMGVRPAFGNPPSP